MDFTKFVSLLVNNANILPPQNIEDVEKLERRMSGVLEKVKNLKLNCQGKILVKRIGRLRDAPINKGIIMILADKPYIETPPNDTPLMHYLNIYQLLSILKQKSLYFSSVSLYKDIREATLSVPSYQEVSKFLLWEDKTPVRKDDGYFRRKNIAKGKGMNGRFEKMLYDEYWNKENGTWWLHTFDELIRRFSRYFIFTHCWAISPTENILMWDRYKHQDATMAIKTRIKRIKNAFAELGAPLYIGKIKYKNYNTEHITGFQNFVTQDLCDPNVIERLFYQTILHKQNIYQSENEVRIIICYKHASQHFINKVYLTDIPFFNHDWGFSGNPDPYRGRYGKSDAMFIDIDHKDTREYYWIPRTVTTSVNINELIENIILSPYTESYVLSLIRDVVKQYGIEPEKVINSSIALR